MVCRSLKQKIDAAKIKLQMLRDLAENISQELDGLPRGNSVESRIEKITAAIVDAENLIFRLIRIKAECATELADYLSKLPFDGVTRQVLNLRYGLCLPFKEIARRLGYHIRQIFKLHAAAMEQFTSSAVAGQY